MKQQNLLNTFFKSIAMVLCFLAQASDVKKRSALTFPAPCAAITFAQTIATK